VQTSQPLKAFADLYDVAFRIADLKELGASAVLYRACRRTSASQVLVGFLQLAAKDDQVIV
jgi:hypothetical protein